MYFKLYWKESLLISGFCQLYEPYTDNPETSGFMRIAPEVLNTIIPNFLRDGWQVVCSSLFWPDFALNLDIHKIRMFMRSAIGLTAWSLTPSRPLSKM